MSTTATSTLKPNIEQIRRCWGTLVKPGDVHEIRIVDIKRAEVGRSMFWKRQAGWYNDTEKVYTQLEKITGAACDAVYMTLNPTDPNLLSRANNRLKEADATTTDDQIIRLRNFLIDIDPSRLSGISATDAEKAAATTLRDEVYAYLSDQGWPAPVLVGDSGNGANLIYRIDLENTTAHTEILHRILIFLNEMFGNAAAHVDETTFNAGRLVKVAGTISAKGDSLPDRPWRQSRANYPDNAGTVSGEQLLSIAGEAPAQPTRPASNTDNSREWSFDDLLRVNNLKTTKVTQRSYGTTYELDHCLTSDAHTDGACLVEFNSGALMYRCHHNSCSGKDWPYLRDNGIITIPKSSREPSFNVSSNGHHPTEPAIDPDTGEVVSRPLTDLGNAERFRDDHKGRARYVHEEKRWFGYARTHWREDTNGAARRLAMKTVRSIYAEAAKVADDRRREKTAQWAHKSESAKAIMAMLSLAGDLTGIATERLDFDHNRFHLNLSNGTYNLQTGKLEDHDPANMITRLTKAAYDPAATSELWESFLEDVTGEQDPWEPMRQYLKRAAGSCLAGWSGDECMYFAYGPTQTGKSTFLEAIRAPLGSYVASLNFDSLLNASTSTPRPDLVAVVGARILVSNEMDRAQRHGDTQLAASLVKRLTSGEPIRVRNNYSNGFDWTPDAVLWLAANDAPEIAHDDEAMWRRIHRIPFNHQHRNADKTIRKRLTNDPEHQAAILTWLIEGWHEYQQHGIEMPLAVKQSTEAYRAEQNPMSEFVASSCTLDADVRVMVSDLNQGYERWCQEQRLEPIDGRTRNAALQSLGCRQVQAKIDGRNKKTWVGIRLKELWD
jgi:putative DNA primase/helicase